MLALGARGREFDSLKSPPVGDGDVSSSCADMAQVVARCADNAEVFGSIPNIRTVFDYFVCCLPL